MEDQVILVNEKDEIVGVGEKLDTHERGLLHRAFSIFIFNSRGELLLQRRALTKYHSPGLWSNTCCGHPRPAEQLMVAAQVRLQTEMGLTCTLEGKGSIVYRADVDAGLVEHEYDHIFIGHCEGVPTLNVAEAIDWKWMGLTFLEKDLRAHPEHYTFWLKAILNSGLLRNGSTLKTLRIAENSAAEKP